MSQLEVQIGTAEAFNRLVEAAERFKRRIDSGDIKVQNPPYAVNVPCG